MSYDSPTFDGLYPAWVFWLEVNPEDDDEQTQSTRNHGGDPR